MNHEGKKKLPAITSKKVLPFCRPTKRDFPLIGIWCTLSLLFLIGVLVAFLNGWRLRTFVFWLAFLLLFVGPSIALYFRACERDDLTRDGYSRVFVTIVSTAIGLLLFFWLASVLPTSENSCKHGYLEVHWSSDRVFEAGYETYAEIKYLFWMNDINLQDPIKHNFKGGSGFPFLP